jgi:hypothetical protein
MGKNPTFTFGAGYLPSLAKAFHAVQDADGMLLGCRNPGHGIKAAMECHRAALVPIHRFLSALKVL